jgi:CRISPR-associated protein Csb1
MPKRHIFRVALEPVAGTRFQPTGFPDLGTGTFKKPTSGTEGWIDCILVESEQSMANHLESAVWDRGTNQPTPEFAGLPYVRVVDEKGEYLTSSRTEAHRLSSAFIRAGKLSDGTTMTSHLKTAFNLRDEKPLSARDIAKAVFELDPACLVHGVFFADKELSGQPKITRALTSFIEAEDVQRADYGGVKKDHVTHSNTEERGSDEGYGSIPYHRTMWTARTITASFVIDLDQIRSYGLDEKATRLIEVLALYEVRALLEQGLRLRTMCDLTPINGADIPNLPTSTELNTEIAKLTKELASQLNNGAALTVTWTEGKKAAGKKAAKAVSESIGDRETESVGDDS